MLVGKNSRRKARVLREILKDEDSRYQLILTYSGMGQGSNEEQEPGYKASSSYHGEDTSETSQQPKQLVSASYGAETEGYAGTATIDDVAEEVDESDPLHEEVMELFREAQDGVFANGIGDIHAMGLTKTEALYGDAHMAPLADRAHGSLEKRTFGVDSAGTLAAENTYGTNDDPHLSVFDHFGIHRDR